jgi:uncharacterized protein YbcC (UPF0753/DUF2309 family)
MASSQEYCEQKINHNLLTAEHHTTGYQVLWRYSPVLSPAKKEGMERLNNIKVKLLESNTSTKRI